MRRSPLLAPTLALLAALVLPACQGNQPKYLPSGDVAPTVAGAQAAAYADAAAAKKAFTREQGSVTATLHDAAWLRFLGSPEEVEKAYPAYFEYGYTTFDVELRAEGFTQATNETFLLEDGLGARLTSRPLRYEGARELVDNKWFSVFQVSFQHSLTREVPWIRLTRVADGSAVEWVFHGGAPAR